MTQPIRPRRTAIYRAPLMLLLLGAFGTSTLAVGCTGGTTGGFVDSGTEAGGDGGTTNTCGEADSDGDGIPDRIEGEGDEDRDSIPNSRDQDSDGDGRSDALEANAGRPYDCARGAPVDTDLDEKADYLDTDSDGNGIPDQRDFVGVNTGEPAGGWAANPSDFDSDGLPDYADRDDDNDTVLDADEVAPTPDAPPDTDRDGLADYRDLDSDGDFVRDLDETSLDQDGDDIPNFRDDDSDNDGFSDTEEAGDRQLTTPPNECARELDAATLRTVRTDGLPDFRDADSDNDGLTDREEMMAGTDRCNPDTDGDMLLDSAEYVWCQRNRRTGCATSASITIPATDYYLILPNGGPQEVRELEFGTSIRVADVFFIFDTTGSMSAVQQAVANTIATPTTGLIDSIRGVINDTHFGVGHYDDFPSGSYGGGNDRALHPLCFGAPGSTMGAGCGARYGGITMTPPARAMDVQAGARAIPAGSGGDGPESQVEALYQIVTNEGLLDTGRPCTTPGTAGCWVVPTACPENTFGYPCFRGGSLAVVIHYTDVDYHNGARGGPVGAYNAPYTGITPAPHNFDQMVMAFQRRGARHIGINGGSQPCEGRLFMYTATSRGGPCFDFRMNAEGTGALDLDGNALVYDLPRGATSSPEDLVNQVTGAVNTLATRVPQDITTGLRNDPMNPAMVDASRFIKRRVPSCEVTMPRNRMCWTPPEGVEASRAVQQTDQSTFYRVVPGTRVRFTVYFQNDGVYAGSDSGVTLFHAYIDVLGDGANRLDEREVFILVPAAQVPIG